MGRHKRGQDHYGKRARAEGYPARSVYKLDDLDRRFRLLGRGRRVLDLGCHPGAWLKYASRKVGAEGRVVGVDLQPTAAPGENTVTLTRDVLELRGEDLMELSGGSFDLLLSDMAPATTGIRETDAQRSLQLCRQALALARECLRDGGSFVCKLFMGQDGEEWVGQLKEHFQTVRRYRPPSTRSRSREIFIVAMGLKK